MATKECFTPLLAVICWIFCQLQGCQSTDVFHLATPQPDNSASLRSCVLLLDTQDILDPNTGLLDNDVLSTSASLLSPSYTTQCVSTHSGYYQLNIGSDTQILRTQLTGVSSTPFDAFLPLPVGCLEKDYLVSTWNPTATGTAFIAMYNPTSLPVNVNISLGPNVTPADVSVDNHSVAGDGIVVEILSGEIKYVTSSDIALDGIDLSATDDIGVMAGNWDCKVLGFGQANHMLEMFPPKTFFSNEYLVPFPTGHVFYATLKIVSLSENSSVDVSLTMFSSNPSTITNTLTNPGDVWSYTQTYSAHIVASGPVMVIQYVPDTSSSLASSMTLVPPVTKWVWSVVVYPLTSYSSDSGAHFVIITLETSQTSGLTVHNLLDGTDQTAAITFSPLDQSDYSEVFITLGPSDLFLVQHREYHTFQVIQYGGTDTIGGVYSFPVSMNTTSCRQTVLDSTSAPTSLYSTSTNSVQTTESTNVRSDTKSPGLFSDDYIYVFASGLVFIVAMLIILTVICFHIKNKYRLSQTNKSFNNCNQKKINLSSQPNRGRYPDIVSSNTFPKRIVSPVRSTHVVHVRPSK